MILPRRHRILRATTSIRNLVAETKLHVHDFMAPLFIIEGSQRKESISSMPDYFRYSIDLAIKEAKFLHQLGIQAILLFIKCEDHLKDNTGKEAVNPNGLMQRSIKALKDAVPEMLIFTDVALDPYSSFGHDGIVEDGKILNDATVEVLAQMSVSHAQAGADFVAPSDMMDGRVKMIRVALEENNFQTGIMSYTAKYASCFYGPFRDALDSAPGFGDKKTYQMDYSNSREAILEAAADIEEGADIVMVKPALAYLDIIQSIKNNYNVPVSAYQVSGEYAMIKASAQAGWVDEQAAMIETLTSIKRAGADLIATYFAKSIALYLNR